MDRGPESRFDSHTLPPIEKQPVSPVRGTNELGVAGETGDPDLSPHITHKRRTVSSFDQPAKRNRGGFLFLRGNCWWLSYTVGPRGKRKERRESAGRHRTQVGAEALLAKRIKANTVFKSDQDRFFDKTVPEPNSGCLLWLGSVYQTGYGQFRLRHGQVAAHRFAWEIENGPIPTDLQLDHLCRQRSCVNVHHLEAVTQAENIRRGFEARRSGSRP